MLGVTGRLRRPAGPPFTRCPRTGQLDAEKDDHATHWSARRGILSCRTCRCGPACGGRAAKAEPLADARPAAPRGAALVREGMIWEQIALSHCRKSECLTHRRTNSRD